jgi:predicted unusual protein kinase regulating ubiquinone biosynthesis (AarF/ABC1/UbiB family)
MTETPTSEAPFDLGRYLRVVRYFAGVFAHFIFWELIVRRIGGRRLVERSATRRWQRIAHRFRLLAVDMGGVLIKLGQFLSVRVDVLPRVVTAELSGLQDEVPAERLEDIQAVIRSEFGRPVDQVFSWLAPQPDAAASLAQVHRARLPSGEAVVVKVQRPRIGIIVETDLRAIRTATQWLKRYRPIRRRVDLDRLYEEFSRTTREELDFVAEGHNAQQFARNFAGDEGVRIPYVYEELSTRCVLVMENVASIKIGDFEAMEAAGISRQQVAHRLFDAYLRQLFVYNLVHADPHPGNLFVEPLESGDGSSTPFRLVFVDFGMVATVPQRMRQHFRDYLIGFATRDAGRLVRAYQGAGVLLPGADLARLEQVEHELMERYAGLTMGQARETLMNDWQGLAHEYRDILYEMPFQIPTELLFIGRAMAILFGMATSLDPDFDPWAGIEPFAKQMAGQEMGRDWRAILGELQKAAQLLFALPGQAERFLGQAARGELTVRSTWTPDTRRAVRRVEVAINRLAGAVVFAALLLAAVGVYLVQGGNGLSYALFGLAVVALLVVLTRR